MQVERRVLELTYSVDQVADIDWSTFSPQDVFVVAETAMVDPLLR